MSYILDALRRADAERERGHVPGLHSQAAAPAAAGAKRPPLAWLAPGAALLAAGVGAGWWLSRPAPAPAVVTDAASRPPARAPAPAPLPSPVAQVAPPPPVAPVPVPRPAPVAPAIVRAPVQVPAAAAPAPAVAPSRPAAAPPSVVAYERLPEEVRRQLPALTIGGAIYSEQASSRMLIVAGALLHEGDAVAPGVTLEEIKPRSAVLRWKGLRYEVGF